jgi:hypothetical protein
MQLTIKDVALIRRMHHGGLRCLPNQC